MHLLTAQYITEISANISREYLSIFHIKGAGKGKAFDVWRRVILNVNNDGYGD